jgi:hypothetical protein
MLVTPLLMATGGATDPAVGLFSATSQSYIAQLSYLSDGFLDAGFCLHAQRPV